MTWFEDPLSALGVAENVFTIIDIFVILILSTVLCYIVAKTYQLTHDGVSYSKNFVQIIVVFGIVVSMIMLIIGSNIARAFTLLGALSIIRFRNAIKETRDVGFIFLMMAIGMATGTRFYVLAIIMTLFVCLLIIIMHKSNFGSSNKKEELLKIVIPNNFHVEEKLEPIFDELLDNYQFISTESTGKKKFNQSVYIVNFKDYKKKNELVKKIREITKNDVYLTETDYLIQ